MKTFPASPAKCAVFGLGTECEETFGLPHFSWKFGFGNWSTHVPLFLLFCVLPPLVGARIVRLSFFSREWKLFFNASCRVVLLLFWLGTECEHVFEFRLNEAGASRDLPQISPNFDRDVQQLVACMFQISWATSSASSGCDGPEYPRQHGRHADRTRLYAHHTHTHASQNRLFQALKVRCPNQCFSCLATIRLCACGNTWILTGESVPLSKRA